MDRDTQRTDEAPQMTASFEVVTWPPRIAEKPSIPLVPQNISKVQISSHWAKWQPWLGKMKLLLYLSSARWILLFLELVVWKGLFIPLLKESISLPVGSWLLPAGARYCSSFHCNGEKNKMERIISSLFAYLSLQRWLLRERECSIS